MSNISAGSSQYFIVCKANLNVSELRGSSSKAKRVVSHFTDEETWAREGKTLAKCVSACIFMYVNVCVCFCVHVQEGL